MCNYIMRNGEVCTRSKTKNRCSLHPLSKFYESVDDPVLAEEMMKAIIVSELSDEIMCPCGKKMKTWNYAKHCTWPKHKAWMKTMPPPKTIRGLYWLWSELSINL